MKAQAGGSMEVAKTPSEENAPANITARASYEPPAHGAKRVDAGSKCAQCASANQAYSAPACACTGEAKR